VRRSPINGRVQGSAMTFPQRINAGTGNRLRLCWLITAGS
jgi:hypothetical protein